MGYDTFKKIFFPHLHMACVEDSSSEDELKGEADQIETIKAKKNHSHFLEQRLRNLERLLKTKFNESYESVRKAFLALDHDYDGYINVEDFYKRFGHDKDIKFEDLKKLVIDKDSKKQGKINY